MTLLQKLKQILINLLGRKITKIPKPTTIDLKTTETIKIPSSDIASKKPLPDIPIKQVEQVSETVIPIITVRCNKDGLWTFSNGEKSTTKLKPGYLRDTCTLMDNEDYPEINDYGHEIANKLSNKPIYVLSTSKQEYNNKKCPKNEDEKIRQQTGKNVHNTGRPRNFNNTLVESAKSLGHPIYYIVIEGSQEIQRLAKKLLSELHAFGLHGGDNVFLAFAKLTKSTIITSDGRLRLSSVQAQCEKCIEFKEFLDNIMKPSPITIVLRERRNYYKNHKNPMWRKR